MDVLTLRFLATNQTAAVDNKAVKNMALGVQVSFGQVQLVPPYKKFRVKEARIL